MLPLGKKPVLHHIIEELKGAGICEIGIVIRKEHVMISEYFADVDGISFIYDDSTSGPGGAILKTASFTGADNFVVIFVDAPLKGERRSNYLRRLLNLKGEENEAVLSIYPIPQPEVSLRGVVGFEQERLSADSVVQLTGIVEKPSLDRDKQAWASSCRYILSPRIFDALQQIEPDKDGELQLTTAIQYLIQRGETILGYSLPKNLRRYDTGNFEGYFEAFRDFTVNSLS